MFMIKDRVTRSHYCVHRTVIAEYRHMYRRRELTLDLRIRQFGHSRHPHTLTLFNGILYKLLAGRYRYFGRIG